MLQESKFNARVRQAGYAHRVDNRVHRSTKYVAKGHITYCEDRRHNTEQTNRANKIGKEIVFSFSKVGTINETCMRPHSLHFTDNQEHHLIVFEANLQKAYMTWGI